MAGCSHGPVSTMPGDVSGDAADMAKLLKAGDD